MKNGTREAQEKRFDEAVAALPVRPRYIHVENSPAVQHRAPSPWSFVRPGVGPLTCRSKVLHRTSTMAFVEGRVQDDKGGLVAHGTGTFKYLRAMPGVGERRVVPLNAPAAPEAAGASE